MVTVLSGHPIGTASSKANARTPGRSHILLMLDSTNVRIAERADYIEHAVRRSGVWNDRFEIAVRLAENRCHRLGCEPRVIAGCEQGI